MIPLALMAITPAIPLALIAVVGGGGYALWRWMMGRGADDDTILPDGDDEAKPDDGDAIDDSDPGGANLICRKTGQAYDIKRFATPVHVAALMIALGYPVSPSLKTSADVKMIKKLQRRFRDQRIGPYSKAPNSWIHGRSGPCFLISLSNAEARLSEGSWLVVDSSSDPNWLEKMTGGGG